MLTQLEENNEIMLSGNGSISNVQELGKAAHRLAIKWVEASLFLKKTVRFRYCGALIKQLFLADSDQYLDQDPFVDVKLVLELN